jgi:hypothetical protein
VIVILKFVILSSRMISAPESLAHSVMLRNCKGGDGRLGSVLRRALFEIKFSRLTQVAWRVLDPGGRAD